MGEQDKAGVVKPVQGAVSVNGGMYERMGALAYDRLEYAAFVAGATITRTAVKLLEQALVPEPIGVEEAVRADRAKPIGGVLGVLAAKVECQMRDVTMELAQAEAVQDVKRHKRLRVHLQDAETFQALIAETWRESQAAEERDKAVGARRYRLREGLEMGEQDERRADWLSVNRAIFERMDTLAHQRLVVAAQVAGVSVTRMAAEALNKAMVPEPNGVAKEVREDAEEPALGWRVARLMEQVGRLETRCEALEAARARYDTLWLQLGNPESLRQRVRRLEERETSPPVPEAQPSRDIPHASDQPPATGGFAQIGVDGVGKTRPGHHIQLWIKKHNRWLIQILSPAQAEDIGLVIGE